MQVREPNRVLNIEGTVIKIYGPGPLTEEERRIRHRNVVNAFAKCLDSVAKQNKTPASK